ncbi:hypothetical protein [Sphingobium sp. CAP-1]|nr:hypothetical protein [Sphingobium sp. CAP-1]
MNERNGFATLEDLQTTQAPNGINLDGNGTLTVAAFNEYARRAKAAKASK